MPVQNSRTVIKSSGLNTRIIRTNNIVKSTIRPRSNALYFYKIYPEDTIPGKKWCLTYSQILKKLFDADPEWQEVKNPRQAHFTDNSQQSPIKSFFRTNADITTKIYLAKTLQTKITISNPTELHEDAKKTVAEQQKETTVAEQQKETIIVESRPEFYPPTLVCINGKIQPILTENQKLFERNLSAKWFLKPSAGYGGSGLRVLDHPQQAKKYITQIAQGFPQETLERNPLKVQRAEYVLQLGIEPYLMQGFKFDIRVWILFTFDKKTQFRSYLYDDAFLRVCSKPYQKDSLNPLINLTNLTYHQDQRSTISKTYTLKTREYYSQVYPKIHQATKVVVDALKKSIVPGPFKGYEIMGFDFILDKELNPHLLEINRHIGWPVTARNKTVVDLIYKMMRETINLAIKPLINPNIPIQLGGWDPLIEFTIN